MLVNVTATESKKNETKAVPPYWKSMTVDMKGLVSIKFSEPLNIPNITNMNSTVLDVTIIPSGSSKYLQFVWNVTRFDNNGFDIQLVFEKPLYVSANGRNYYDKVSVLCKINEFFTSKQSFVTIVPDTEIVSDIPPQLSTNAKENAVFTTVQDVA